MIRTATLSALSIAALTAFSMTVAHAQQTTTEDEAPAAETSEDAAAETAPAAAEAETAPAAEAEQAAAEEEAPAAAEEETPAAAEQQAQQQPAQAPQVRVAGTNGDWRTLCIGESDNCYMSQIGRTADGQEILEMSIRKVPPQETKAGTIEAVLDVRVPLGVMLTEGLAIAVDASEPQTGAYRICTQQGCLLREPLPGNFIARFKKGAKATISFKVPNQNELRTIQSDISLRGFTASYNGLKIN